MKKLFLGFVLLVVAMSGLHANLNETEVQILERYGKKIGPDTSLSNRDVSEYFVNKNYVVTVTLIDRQSHREAFSRKETPAKPMTDSEITALLDANTLGSKWEMSSENKTYKIWMLDSKLAIASYDKTQYILTIQTRMMIEFDNALKNLSQKPGQGGGQ
ncbi:MAG: hypothetical protein WCD79_19625 [Chthoniobacteraceae bacterium]